MLSPHIKMYNDMPNLVDPNSPASFHAAPPGASSGGQPGGFGGGGYGFGGGGGGGGGFFDAFPGASQQRESPWPPTFGPGTPHPNAANLAPGYPWGVGGGGGGPSGYPGFGGSAPHSAPPTTGWGFNAPSGYPAGGFNNTPALSWGAQTPAGSYGAPVTPGGAPPFGFGGGGYTPWSAPGGGGGFEGFGSGGIALGGFVGAPSPHYPPWEPPKKEKKRKEKRSSSMKRAVSEGPNGQHGKKEGLSRSNSFGHLAGQGVFGWAGAGYYPAFSPMGIPTGAGAIGQQEIYGPRNLARRPRDWRADYNPRGGLASYLPGVLSRDKSDVSEITDTTKRTLHPLLQFDNARPPIALDLRQNPLNLPPHSTLFLNLSRPHNNIDFAQLATSPATSHMRLYHPLLPWYIDVRAAHPNGVTVYDLLTQMYRQLMMPITGRHFYNEDFGEEERAAVTRAFAVRVGRDEGETGRGVVQVDWLGDRVVFEGLVRGKGGMWEVKTARAM
ncbi:hypothetical protein D9611_010096 [Ephemerocybe angulata]|uniref:DUF6699 domain-containing protein n=1 Tax=Ephemerocybe angulata TaxID=980116 RepID=A0A8H5AZ33_9AGAR|nr:hypothetical protein D9611_010096 [Tulosesus angulatus]